MLKTCVPALAVAVCAGSSLAQIDQSRFNLNVTPVLRTYADNHDGTFTASDVSGPLSIDTSNPNPLARTVRLELRYNISVTGSATGTYQGPASGSDPTLVTYQSAGLASAACNLLFSKAVASSWIAPAPIGGNVNANPGYANPDPNVDPGAGYGVYSPWRTGVLSELFGNNNNGQLSSTQITNILPITTSSPNQPSSQIARSWSFYAIDFIIPQGWSGSDSVTFSVGRSTNGSGVAAPWLFFPRTNNATTNAIQGQGMFTGGAVTINFTALPAPGAGATLALGGLAAARRRRR